LAVAIIMAMTGLFAGEARADVYACKDRQGVVSFSDRKLKGMRCVLYAKTPPPQVVADTAPSDVPTDGGNDPNPAPSGGNGMSKAEVKRLAAGGAFDRPRPATNLAPAPTGPSVGAATGRFSGNEPESLKEREALYGPFIEEAAVLYKLPFEFIAAVIRVESNFRYRVTSSAGAMGLMQLMPVVVREMGVDNPWDPRANVMGGARLLRTLADRYEGDMVKVLAAYHAGAGAVKSADGIPYEATESYVRTVLDRYYEYRSR
jgi:hypothetical protein